MDKKLTLSLKDTVIEQAKEYAKSNNTSVSKLIEAYLALLTKKNKEKSEITPLVKELSGVLSANKNFDIKESYTDYLIEKYK
jgi:predicted metalloendopeptidase|tara:strand:- start:1078 stop:1323 length:246 start_codon:yes stop_codon:yes gene_type:complete